MKTNRNRTPPWVMILLWILCAVILGGCGPLVRIEEVHPTARTSVTSVPITPLPTTPSTPIPTEPATPTAPTTPTAQTTPAPTIPSGSIPTAPTESPTPGTTRPQPSSTTTRTEPTVLPTTAATSGIPGIVVESDEIVPVPDSLVLDFNEALDALLDSIDQLENPDPADLETP